MVSSELVVLLIVCVGIRAELLEGTVATAQCHKFSITHERMYSIFHYYMYVLYNCIPSYKDCGTPNDDEICHYNSQQQLLMS